MIYSFSGICSKTAAQYPFMSFKFVLFYGIVIFLLGVYAIGWQQVIKRMPLTTAYANKSATVVWGLIWGCAFFSETMTLTKILGALLVIAGVIIYSYAEVDNV